MIRVGLIVSPKGWWQGGINYFQNLLSCYQQNPDPEIKLIVLTDCPEEVARHQSDSMEVFFCPSLSLRDRKDLPRRAIDKLINYFPYDPVLLHIAKRHKIDLLTHRSLGRQTAVKTLYWQPDFQHKRLPHFFNEAECTKRDRLVANVRLWGDILLSSQAAANDFRRYYPELTFVRAHVLRFSSAAALNVVPLSRSELEARYSVRGNYFFLPNQFWIHKNHEVVIEALRRTSPEIRVVCTGSTVDYRDPFYFPRLMENVKLAGLEQRFICLGSVPYETVVSLMHHSVAVLQPSLFEGWSTTVEESKSMSKQIILSNIDVHLEQAPERGIYFSPESPDELAEHLKRVQADYDPVIEQGFAEQRLANKARIERDWIVQFARILKSAWDGSR